MIRPNHRLEAGDGFGNDLKAAPFERYFWARNAPYASTDPCNPLISQQMRPPSERTTNPRLALKSLRFLRNLLRQVTTLFSPSVATFRIGQGLKIVHVLALIERDDLVHAADDNAAIATNPDLRHLDSHRQLRGRLRRGLLPCAPFR